MKVYAVIEENRIGNVITRLVGINKTYKGACEILENEVKNSLRDERFERYFEDDCSVVLTWKPLDENDADDKEVAIVYWITARELGK